MLSNGELVRARGWDLAKDTVRGGEDSVGIDRVEAGIDFVGIAVGVDERVGVGVETDVANGEVGIGITGS